MPLNERKTLHLLATVTRTFASRQRTIVLVYRTSDGYSYSAIQAIMRSIRIVNPLVLDYQGRALPQGTDTILIAPRGTNVTGAIFIADTPDATAIAIASAPKYEIIEVLPSGMVPGGSRLRIALRRLR